ncbi:MAG: methyltransferase [Actinomycetaceae bacterium]|nr:methyltransferase [Actinomycetaceae bacterium]MDY5854024.1 methyltransferase [Arcanobacterium sp.]
MSEHYFTAKPSSEARERTITYSARGFTYSVLAPDGVFSAQQLDRGTQVLLAKAPHTDLSSAAAVTVPECTSSSEGSKGRKGSEGHHSASQDLLTDASALCVDVGCGWGPITFALAREYPGATVLGVDINERALAAARRNAQRLGLDHAVTIEEAQSALQRLQAAGTYIDLIWSNPPIRIGKTALHELLTAWLSLLRPETGEAYWVVQKNLGADSLVAWLSKHGFPSEKIGSSKGYRIIRSVNHCAVNHSQG